MAPVEIDHIPRSIISPVKNMKIVDKAMSLPLVSSAYTEVTRMTSPYMESTMSKVSPVVETTMSVVTGVRSRVEDKVLPHIPVKITETVTSVQNVAVDHVASAVEKVRSVETLLVFIFSNACWVSLQVDSFACGGIDQLTDKVPQLKEAPPKIMEETKVM